MGHCGGSISGGIGQTFLDGRIWWVGIRRSRILAGLPSTSLLGNNATTLWASRFLPIPLYLIILSIHPASLSQ